MENKEVEIKKENGFFNVSVIQLITFAVATFVVSYFAMIMVAKGI